MAEVLVLDTSDKQGFVASARIEGGLLKDLSSWTLSVEASHSERLLWTVHQVLESRQMKVQDIDVIGVGVGPGSFTGLRIGVSTARTWSQVLKKPLVAFSSLRMIAEAVRADDRTVHVVRDAFRGEWYVGTLRSLNEYEERRLSADELSGLLKLEADKSLFVTTGRTVQDLTSGEVSRVDSDRYLGLLGSVALRWAATHVEEGDLLRWRDVVPNYLRESHAELKLKSGELQVKRGREESFAPSKKS